MLHALLAKAKKEDWSADQVFAEAEKIGSPINDEGFKAFVHRIIKK